MYRLCKILSSIMVVVLLSLVVLTPMSSKASTSSIEPVTYNGTYADFQAYLAAESLSADIMLYVIGFLTLCVVTARNIEVNLDFTTTVSLQDKLKAYGEYAVNNLWSSVKDIVNGIVVWQNANNVFTWSDLTHVGIMNALSLVKNISFGVGDFVSSPSSVATGLIDMSGVSGNVPVLPIYQYANDVNQFLLNTYGISPALGYIQYLLPAYDGILTYYAEYPVSGVTGSYAVVNITSDQCYLAFYNANGYQLSRVRFLNHQDSIRIYQGNLSVKPHFGNTSDYRINTNFNSDYITFNCSSSRSYGLVNDFSVFMGYLTTLGVQGFYLYEGSNFTAMTSLNIGSLTHIIGDVPAAVNVDSNYLVFPSAEDITVDLTTLPDRLATLDSTSSVNQRVEALTGFSAVQTVVSAVSDSVVPTVPSYNFPSLNSVWQYPRYLFDTVRPFFVMCGDILGSVTVGSGGLSWIYYGALVMGICGGVIGKFLQ